MDLGDSRLYLFREKSLQCLSKDHTQAQLLVEHGLLKKEEARTHLGGHVLNYSIILFSFFHRYQPLFSFLIQIYDFLISLFAHWHSKSCDKRE